MRVYNIHWAKTHLSRLVEMAVNGEPFVIAKGGKPMVKVTAFEAGEQRPASRMGFMKGEIMVPDDFDRMGSDEIEQMFGLRP